MVTGPLLYVRRASWLSCLRIAPLADVWFRRPPPEPDQGDKEVLVPSAYVAAAVAAGDTQSDFQVRNNEPAPNPIRNSYDEQQEVLASCRRRPQNGKRPEAQEYWAVRPPCGSLGCVRGKRAQDLGTLGGTQSIAFAVNDSGQVVGASMTADNQQHAFSWTRSGGMIDLGTLGGSSSSAVAVNASGRVVGSSNLTDDIEQRAFSWTPSDGMIDLGTLGGTQSTASAVNALGQVVGQSLTSDGVFHAFLWTPSGGMIDLGTLGGSSSVALAVNDSAQVVGYSSTAGDSELHAVLWLRADLSVSKTDSPDPAHVGQKLTYTVLVTNNGPDPATVVTLSDTLPKTAGFGSVTTTQGTCTRSKTGVKCSLGGLASGATATVTIVVKPTQKGTITNTVTAAAGSPTTDPNIANNTATQSTTVRP